MRPLTSLALTGLVALVATGLAIAEGGPSRTTSAAAATFTAAPTEKSKTRQCTGADGTYNVTQGVYKGTATGDARLSGEILIRTKTVVNVTSGLGWTQGHVVLRDADGETKAKANLVAVNTQSGILNGFLNGRVKGETGGHLLANFSAAFNAAGTSLTGQLGGTSATSTDSAIITRGGCDLAKAERASSEKTEARKKRDAKPEATKRDAKPEATKRDAKPEATKPEDKPTDEND